MPLKEHPIHPKKEKISKQDLPKSTIRRDEKTLPNDEFDSKKEFFRLMAEKIKEESNGGAEIKRDIVAEKKSLNVLEKNDSLNSSESILSGGSFYYKKLFLRFLFLALILVLAVAYFSFFKLSVVVNVNKESLDESLNFYAYSSSDNQINLDRAIKASVNRVELEVGDIFYSTGEKNLDGQVVGKVKIINSYSKNQPLVATTRILSSDDKLFRLKNTVNVPAGGSVEVEVYADNPSAEMAISPSKFTIPGLWAGLQDKIYAESYEKFEFKQEVKKYIAQEDIDGAISVLNDKILKQAENSGGGISDSQNKIFGIEANDIKIEIDKEVGDESDSFEVKIKGVVNIVVVNKEDVEKIVEQRLAVLDFDANLSEIDLGSFKYTLLNFNSAKSLAEIRVDFSVKTTPGGEDGAINKKHLVNLNEKQIRAYLDNVDELESYELIFRPRLIKRAPMLLDRITVEYK